MAHVAGLLYLSGAVLVAVSLFMPGLDPVSTVALAAITASAALVGGVFILLARRVTLPEWVYVVTSALGTLVVTGIVVWGDPVAAPVYGVFYVYVAAYDFLYMSRRVAILETAFAGACFALALAIRDLAGWPSMWLIVMGASVVAGYLIGTVGHRERDAFLREREASDRLRDIDEMKNTFLQAVSHELRTPLTILTGIAETLHSRAHELEAAEIEDLAARQVLQAERLRSLLVDLLDVDRLSRGAMRPRLRRTRVDSVVEGILAAVEYDEHHLDADLEPVEADVDPGYVERIIENLVLNAFRHTPDGTDVRVVLTTEDSSLLLTVEDAGPGVPEERRREVFEPFNRGDERSGGIGIGLALVQALTTAHDGECWVEDSPLGGAAFHVLLPLRGRAPNEEVASTGDRTL